VSVQLILDALRLPGATNLKSRVEWAAHTIRKHDLVVEAIAATESAGDTAARWLYAVLASDLGHNSDLLDAAWARVVDAQSRDIPSVLAHRARLALSRSETGQAAQFLRQAYFCDCDASTLVRTESLAKKIFTNLPHRKQVRVALLGSANTMMLRTALQLFGWRDGIRIEFHEPEFGTYAHEILNSDSALYRFKPDFAVLLENWRDLASGGYGESASATAGGAVRATSRLWDRLLEHDCTVIHVVPNPPGHDPDMGLSLRDSGGRSRLIHEINRELLERAPDRVLLVDSATLAARVAGPWEDAIQWSSSRIYPSLEALPVLAEAILSNVRYASGLNPKLLALDLDNTLWGGVIGEDGMAGIKLGPPSPVGERYQTFQTYLKDLSRRGVLLAAVSKNNREDAVRVFAEHDASVLKQSDFAAFEANWDSKVESLRRIALNLRLGLDSFVYLDDNPVERALVRTELPEVITPNISGEPAESISAIERFQFFQTSRVTDEDRNRSASYQALSATSAATTEGVSDELLASLQISIEMGPVDEITSNRVAQLINKTNQFNLTSRRYSLAEVTDRMKSDAYWFRWYRLKDRFADHGLVGVILVDKQDPEWRVDLWLMSCRVIGRKLEHFMFNSLVMAARKEQCRCIRAEYIRSAKNGLVSELLPGFGFDRTSEEGQYELDPSTANVAEATFVNLPPSLVVS
jgi:FkbH-like protein